MTEYFVHLSASLAPQFPWWNVGGAGKAHHDREVFAAEIGFAPLGVFLYQWEDEPANVLRGRMDGLLGGLKRNDIVFVQWPMSNGSPNWHHEFVQGIHGFEAKLVYVVDDLYSWRTRTFTDDSAALIAIHLAAKQPLLYTGDAPLAELLRRNNLGIELSNTEAIAETIQGVTTPDYHQLILNVERLAMPVRSGYYLRRALLALDLQLNLR